MEKAVLVNSAAQARQARGYSRVYFGSEFCQCLIPSPQEVRRVLEAASAGERAFTLLTPFVTEAGLKPLERVFSVLDAARGRPEVVFNDWGVFSLLRERFPRLRPVLGRLLTKQRRDPRAADILLNRQAAKKIYDRLSGKTTIFLPKPVSRSLFEVFQASVISAPAFAGFLLENGVGRAEVDNLAWQMKIDVPARLKLSVYLPFGYVTTTRLCGLVNLTFSRCRKECRKYFLSFPMKASRQPFYLRGRTVFYQSEPPGQGYLSSLGIDRVIHEPYVPA